ncbi:hypothetical protein BUALT_Bualt11G0027100 [Buddleja alternifolia]|uniref:BZIP transcription factor n=1 Tax=Buddleja alternifolia TaxID=168488 RepID=A0AAV6X2P8_9LAMI|nr:hypothetical protein BUALT_Bualt11G0027100 [Buddleja alternifolia]
MGIANSKVERSSALKLCKERKGFIKQASDSRYALAAAHVSYVHSLRNIGIALRRYAEAEVLVEASQSASATELDKTPSPSSYPSPSQSHLDGVSDSPVLNGSPVSPSTARVSYMRSSGASALTVRVSPPPRNVYVEEGEFSMPPPPPPPPESGSLWDYFEPSEESFRFVGQNGLNFDDVRMYGDFGKKEVDLSEIQEGAATPKLETSRNGDGKSVVDNENCDTVEKSTQKKIEGEVKEMASEKEVNASIGKASNLRKNKSSVEKDICAEREDPSEFITHRVKDFLSSIKDIDNRFFRASESGKEISRMLESSKIHVGYGEARGNHLRTTSSRSSSSRNPLATKDDNDDSGSDFIEEFSMISGSHSSTLDRLYAWERKLYDEVKASESIQREYDRKCDQLRHQFAKDLSPQIIDKTRAVVKDLHSRIRVALHAVDSISKRIEKMRDEELLPQLFELIQGLTRIYTSYVESLNSWLQNCILQPRERHKGRRAFFPRSYLAPPIFVLCRDWTVGIKSLPSQEVSDAIKAFLSDLRRSVRNQAEELQKRETVEDLQGNEAEESKDETQNEDSGLNISCIQGSLTRVLDRLTKFSEASVKMCEDIKQKCDSARNAYENYKAPPRSFSI